MKLLVILVCSSQLFAQTVICRQHRIPIDFDNMPVAGWIHYNEPYIDVDTFVTHEVELEMYKSVPEPATMALMLSGIIGVRKWTSKN